VKVITQQFALFRQTIQCDTRSLGFFFLRLGLAFLLTFCFYLFQTQASRTGGAKGLMLFTAISGVNICFTYISSFCLFLPLVREEKEEDTLGLILMTGISPFAYIVGKCGSRMATFVMMLAIQLPFTVLCVTLGGISLKLVLLAYLLVFSFMFFQSSLCFFVSLFTNSFISGIFITCAFSYLAHYLLMLVTAYAGKGALGYTLHGSEVFFFPVILLVEYLSSFGAGASDKGIIAFMAACLVAGVGFFLLSILLFNWINSRQFKEVDLSGWKKKIRSKAEASPSSERSWLLKILSPRFGKNALRSKDFHFSFKGKLLFLFQLVALLLFVWMDSFSSILFNIQTVEMARDFVQYCLGVMVCLCIFCGHQFFGREIKNNTLETLLVLPISGRRLFWSKIQAFLVTCSPTLCLILIGAYYGELFSESVYYNCLFVLCIYMALGLFVIKVLKKKRFMIPAFCLILCCSFIFNREMFWWYESYSFHSDSIMFVFMILEFSAVWIIASLYITRYTFFFSILCSFSCVLIHFLFIEIIDENFNMSSREEATLFLTSCILLIQVIYQKVISRITAIGERS
jgi:hypothetical protein